jgi:hypothetical protein
MLLKLPGELRDMIIDHVLLTPLPVPSHDFITYSPRTYGTITPSSRFPSTYSTQPLLHTNHQLHAETTLRASKLDIPLVLDICCWIDVSCRKNSRCVLTWLNQRWGEPATWGRIPRMDIRIRVLPIDLEHRPGGGMHLVDLGLQREGVLGYVASMALRVARKPICTVLSAQHHIATARLVNSIRHIHISFGAAAHEPGDPGVLHAPGSIVAAIAQRLSSRAVAGSTLFPDTHLRRWLEDNPILTHVGAIQFCAAGARCWEFRGDGIVRYGADGGRADVGIEPGAGKALELWFARGKMGWDADDWSW